MRLMSSALLFVTLAVAFVAGAVADNSASHAVDDGHRRGDLPSGSQSGSKSLPWHHGNHTWRPNPWHHGNHTWRPNPWHHGNHT
eukprot:CAMPEP_0174827198 /NCGR_PEP_ID=MMETSP1114-20130205/548_1 /TAXON_ID=312471 /ORGANISM="Neobodo designis, Strain CCAP 1951/1" /LENGTH=83 /DNA_ID=CAMNT_0016060805 /DNA_START=67 /DNA_END=314 /DNA_ORIENTATION=+